MTKCDDCLLVKSPIIFLRSSRKLCRKCFDAERLTIKDLINNMNHVVPWEPLLGYHFIMNDWFSDQAEGRRYTDWLYGSFGSVSN